MEDGLFELDTPAREPTPAPAPMTLAQREVIRELFSTLGIADAKGQFEVVAELTGRRIASVGELDAATANTLIPMLTGRASRANRATTGNSWADRDEDTWIDQL